MTRGGEAKQTVTDLPDRVYSFLLGQTTFHPFNFNVMETSDHKRTEIGQKISCAFLKKIFIY